MVQPEGVEQFYDPTRWRVTLTVGEHVIVQTYPLQGHHLATAAGELLRLYTGTGSDQFGMLTPTNREPIIVRIEPVDE